MNLRDKLSNLQLNRAIQSIQPDSNTSLYALFNFNYLTLIITLYLIIAD